MIVLSLCDYSGVMVQPWASAGFECYCVDIANQIRVPKMKGGIHYVWGDVRSWLPPKQPCILFAFPPCTHLAVSGARDFAAKGWPLLRDGLDLFFACITAAKWAGCPYMIENPVGRISGLCAPDQTFNPCDYGGYLDPPGDTYTKKTCLWTGNGFIMPEPRPVYPVEGSKMHGIPPGKDRERIRSQTPKGFAQAVFEANVDMVRKAVAA